MKRTIIILIYSLAILVWNSLALDVDSPISSTLEKLTKNNLVILDEWTNTFAWTTNNSDKVSLETNNNTFLSNNYTNFNSDLTITCKNWYIEKIKNDNYYEKRLNEVILSYNYSNYQYNSRVTLQCNPITPDKVIDESTDINYAQVTQKTDSLLPPFPKTIAEPQISSTTIEENFASWKIPNEQPTFIDVNYLQLSNIWNLLNSIIIQYPSINISDLFSNYSEYTWWINKFKTYPNKEDFINAFSWAITLKDIWIAQDIINWLYKDLNSWCLSTNSCEKINFKNPNDKFQVYNFDEIESTLYKTSNNLINQATWYYQKMETQCSNLSNIHDNFLKEQTENLCNSLFTGETDSVWALYNLWYALWQRVENLNKIKTNLWNTWTNLLWIYNIYWELNNITLWWEQSALVAKANDPNLDTTWQSEILQKIAKLDINLLSKWVISDIDTAKNTTAIMQTIWDSLTYNSTWYRLVKSNIPNSNLFNTKNYEVNNWIVSKIDNLDYNNDANEINPEENEISDVNFDSFRTISAKINWENRELDLIIWNPFDWTYILDNEKDNYKNDESECYNSSLEKICFRVFCTSKLNQDKYDDCIDNILKKYDYIKTYTKIFKTYWTYHQKEK